MLKITELQREETSVMLKLEGRVGEAWTDELRTICELELSKGCKLTLDLSDVQFVERKAIPILQDMLDRKVKLVNCSPLLTRQIGRRNGYVE